MDYNKPYLNIIQQEIVSLGGETIAKLRLDILKKFCAFSKGDRSLTSEIESVYNILSSGQLYRDISQYLTLE